MKTLYLGFMRILAKVENTIAYTGLILCSLLIVAQVINRYILHFEIMWLSDLALYFYIPTGMCCIAITARHDAHTSVDVFADLLFGNNQVARKAYKIIVCGFVLCIFAYLLPLSFKLFQTAWKYPEWATLVRWFNTSWNREFLAICLCLSCLHTIHTMGVHIVELRAMLRQGVQTTTEAAS